MRSSYRGFYSIVEKRAASFSVSLFLSRSDEDLIDRTDKKQERWKLLRLIRMLSFNARSSCCEYVYACFLVTLSCTVVLDVNNSVKNR